MNWTTVVIMGCSFGIAAGLEYSGAGIMIAHGMINLLGDAISPWLLASVLAFAAVLFTNFMSSTSTAALLIPIAAIVANELGYDVRSVVIAVAIAANIGYATPISTPPITMTLIGGYRFMDYVKFGGLFNLMAYVLVILLFPIFLNL
jgi:di/tricarboxylate transporter